MKACNSLLILIIAAWMAAALGAQGTSTSPVRVVFVADPEGVGDLRLYSVRPGEDPVQLSDAADGVVSTFTVSPDGLHVAYRGTDSLSTQPVHVAPIDGSGPRLLLDPGEGFLFLEEWSGIEFTPAGDRVLFVTPGFGSTSQLGSAPIDGSSASADLSGAIGIFLGPQLFLGSQDGTDAYFVGPFPNELYRAPSDGSQPPVVVSGTPIPCLGVTQYHQAPAGDWMVFSTHECTACGGHSCNGASDLRSFPIDGSLPPIQLASGAFFGDSIVCWEISAGDTRVVYGQANVLRSVRVDGTDEQLLSVEPPSCHFSISPAGANVVYISRTDTNANDDLFVTPIVGGEAPVRLNEPLIEGGRVHRFEIDPTGDRVVYMADQDEDEVVELFSVPIDRGLAPVQLNSPLPPGGEVLDFQITADGHGVVAKGFIGGGQYLRFIPIDGSTTSSLVAGPHDDISAFAILEHGQRVAYLASDGTQELFIAPTDGSSPPVKLNAPLPPGGTVVAFEVAPRSVSRGVDRPSRPPTAGGTLPAPR